MSLPVTLVQPDIVWEDKLANFSRLQLQILSSPPKPGGLLILPEMFATGFSCAVDVTAEPMGAETEGFLRQIAMRYHCCVLGGLVTRAAPTAVAKNQALAISPTGQVLARYTKMRPFSLGGEAEVHERGTEPVVFEWGGVRISPLICYDLRFPELARQAVAQGAEVLIYIAAWPVKRYQHWLTLLQARAIENQAYVIGVNRTGSEPSLHYNGRSVVVNPQGILIADAGEAAGVLQSLVDMNELRSWRQEFPALRDAGLIE